MKSSTTSDFWSGYRRLPPPVRLQARKAYHLWSANPRHPSLRFEKKGHYWSARISLGYRALGRVEDGVMYWFWIGKHDDYERALKDI
ncbi:MAG TPA: hypothetical protein VFC44_07055 [Candidatus Saccharimonadales bacterium]|nr:hypothetical protein [Candidatus Saccharimonadales bacterium]